MLEYRKRNKQEMEEKRRKRYQSYQAYINVLAENKTKKQGGR